jgi:4-carboxymuconolactone decarboxylase
MLIGAGDAATMTAAQRSPCNRIISGLRGEAPKPLLAMLDAPHLAVAIQAMGAAIRFGGAFPRIASVVLGRAGASEGGAVAGYYPLLALFLATAGLDHPVGD